MSGRGVSQLSKPNRFVIAVDPKGPPAGLERAVFAIGNFDGAHLGHRAVIERTKRLAAELGAPSAVLTLRAALAPWAPLPAMRRPVTPDKLNTSS